jgi:ribose transport system substrate-binding protein
MRGVKSLGPVGVGLALVAAVLVAAAAGTAATSTSGTAAAKPRVADLSGMKFAFAIATAANPLIVSQGKLFEQGAKKLGAEVAIYDNKGTAQDMLTNAQLMVASKPDVIVIYPSAADATSRVSQIFKRAGIPCISVNVPVEGCPLLNFDQPYLAGLAAKAMAAQMKKRGWTGDNTTVVIGQAAKYGPAVNVAVTSFYDKLSKLVPGMKHVPASNIKTTTTTISGDQGLQVDLDFTADIAFPAMTRALQSIPKDRHIVLYTTADDVTVAALRALKNAGRLDDTIVSGFGGSPVSIKALRSGNNWVTEQTGFFANWGQFALAMAAAVKQGAKLPALTMPPMTVLTKENVNKYFKPGTTKLILMPPLPKPSQYLVKTGVLQKFGNVAGAR